MKIDSLSQSAANRLPIGRQSAASDRQAIASDSKR